MKTIIAVILAVCSVNSAEVREKIAIDGKCPVVPFVSDFDSAKFVGKWYAVKETGKEIPCVSYDIEETRPSHFHGFMSPLNFTVEFDKKNVDDFADGLTVTFKVNPYMDGGDLRIFSTDYENYAGIFVCKETEDFHYQTITYWSRTKALSGETLANLDEALSKYERINLSYMKDVKQDTCEA